MRRPPDEASLAVAEIERWLDLLFIAAEGAGLRDEDRKKAREVAPLLVEIRRAITRLSRARDLTLVDAAAGKAYVGLLAAELVLAPTGRRGRVVAIERDAARSRACLAAASRLSGGVTIECRVGDVGDAALWPEEPDLVVALHACGPATDAVIDRAIGARARSVLLVPCCYGAAVPAEALADAAARSLGIPAQAPVRRRFAQAIVDAERTLRLEAAGYQTEVVELVAPTLTPHNLVWRARRVGEPGRMADAAAKLARLRKSGD